jgi:hypothetical protein
VATRPNAQTNRHLEKLEAERRGLLSRLKELEAEVTALMGEVRGIERAMQLLRGTSPETETTHKEMRVTAADIVEDVARGRSPRGVVKNAVLKLLTEHAERGLVAAELVELAAAQGIRLDRGSVSSLLSRLKQEGTLDYVGGRYKPAPPPPSQKAQAQDLL